MIRIDKRLTEDEMVLIKSFVGKFFSKVLHDPFAFTNSTSQAAELVIDNETVYLYSFTEPQDYFGSTEDVAVWTLEKAKYPIIAMKHFISMPIGRTIKKIYIVQDHQQLFHGGILTYDVRFTKGIIFEFEDYQISFEKAVWFSEEIYIQKGYDLLEKFVPTEEFCSRENWSDGVTPKCERNVVEIE